MSDTDNGGGPLPEQTGLKNPITLARVLVLAIPLLLILIGAIYILSGSDLFASFQPGKQIATDVTNEAALARSVERESQVLDVLSIVIDDTGLYFWINNEASDRAWTESEQNGVDRALGVMFMYARDRELEVGITFFSIVQLMGIDGELVNVFQEVIEFNCPSDLIAEYDGNSDFILTRCGIRVEEKFISPEEEVPLLGR